MARVREPRHPLEKRELLHREPPDARRIDALAGALLDEGRAGESVEYIEVTRNPELIDRLLDYAREHASPFLLGQVERLRGKKLDPSEWVAVAERALADGRAICAVRALQLCGEEERAEAIRLEHCPDYDPFKPLGK